MAAQHRAGELLYAKDVTATELLDPETYEKNRGKTYDAFYGKSWTLYHYLTFSPQRQGQFRNYLNLLQGGKSSAEAGRTSFGDLAQLEKDLEKYLKSRTITAYRVPPERLQAGPIAIRELSAGEAAMMPIRVRSRRGVDEKQAAELLPEARAIAARYPGDASVLSALAEAEYDADHDDEAIAAANAALAIDPGQVNAYVQKGYAMFRKADDATDRVAAYRAARAPFLALNKLENDHPLPLVYYYLSFRKQGIEPSDNAVEALEHASELAPFDLGLRFMLVQQQISSKQYDRAISNLTPIAYNPHGGPGTGRARALLDRLKSGDGLDSLNSMELFAEIPDVGSDESEGDGKDTPQPKPKGKDAAK
jgi:tetratricopeptide (TPR) repeat protein